MKRVSPAIIVFCVSTLFFVAGCSHKTDVKTELDKTEAALAATETPTAASPAPVPAPAPEPTPNAPAEPVAIAQPDLPPSPAQQMQLAIRSYKSGELEDAVVRLQKLRMTPTLTSQQRMSLQDSVAAVMTEVYTLASQGNERAVQAVKQYEEMQTSRH
jgi:hypothetical protein